jgi:hypothetical protein
MWIRIRAVIIEDEPLAAQYLAALLARRVCDVLPLADLLRWLGDNPARDRTRHPLRRSALSRAAARPGWDRTDSLAFGGGPAGGGVEGATLNRSGKPLGPPLRQMG